MASVNDDNEPKSVDIAKLAAEQKADKLRQDQAIKNQRANSSRNKKLTFGAVGAVAALLFVAVVIYDPFTGSLRWGSGPDTVAVAPPTTNNGVPDPYAWAKKTGAIFPEKTRSWEEGIYWDATGEESEAAKNQKYWDTKLRTASQVLPSEAAGFTSDDSKAVNEDGTLNPMYSYWTQESFYGETINILERFNNPVYGGWNSLQYAGGSGDAYKVLSTIFSDVIVPDTLASGSGKETIPVFADWAGDDYGMGSELLAYGEGQRWLGKIDSMDAVFTFNSDSEQYDVILTANVTYSAWTKNKSTVTKNGMLTIHLAANVDKAVPTGNKVVVKSATLEI